MSARHLSLPIDRWIEVALGLLALAILAWIVIQDSTSAPGVVHLADGTPNPSYWWGG